MDQAGMLANIDKKPDTLSWLPATWTHCVTALGMLYTVTRTMPTTCSTIVVWTRMATAAVSDVSFMSIICMPRSLCIENECVLCDVRVSDTVSVSNDRWKSFLTCYSQTRCQSGQRVQGQAQQKCIFTSLGFFTVCLFRRRQNGGNKGLDKQVLIRCLMFLRI